MFLVRLRGDEKIGRGEECLLPGDHDNKSEVGLILTQRREILNGYRHGIIETSLASLSPISYFPYSLPLAFRAQVSGHESQYYASYRGTTSRMTD